MPVLAMMMKAPRSFYPHLPSGISQSRVERSIYRPDAAVFTLCRWLLPTGGTRTLSHRWQRTFFWAVGNENNRIPRPQGSGLLTWTITTSPANPVFTAGPAPSRFNPQRAGYYRDKPESHALARYMNDSWLCVLLDGHHKATAAALEGRPVKTGSSASRWR